MWDLSGIGEPRDLRLAAVMAEALLAAEIGREAEARALFERALDGLSDGPLRARALTLLADVLARGEQPELAVDTRTAALRLQYLPNARANSYYNRGEALLELEELELARADYVRAIDLATEPELLASSRYGLAVALERLGDLPSAYDVLDAANAIRLPSPPYAASDPLELPEVYFVPAYERSYLEALRSMARARRAQEGGRKRAVLEQAAVAWDLYLEGAPDDVPYRKNARAQRKRVADEIARLPGRD
jgi:tetratricopeptide (TPR) repeat protein